MTSHRRLMGSISWTLGLMAACTFGEVLHAENVFYVSPQGKDDWPGRMATPAADGADGPVATLHRAVELSRRAAAEEPRRIVLQPGRYFLDRPVDLGPDDRNLTIEAGGGEVTLYGGRPITGWRRDGEKFWSADLPEVQTGKWDFRMLAVADRLCPRARLPEEGVYMHLSEFKVPWMSTTGGGWKRKPTPEELTTMKYRSEDLGPWLDVNNAELTVYHMWDESVVGLAGIDTDKQLLTFSTPAGHPPGAFGVKKYVVWNVRQGMTQPGQWYLDRAAGKVVYWPLPGEDMNTVETVAPTIESILRIRGQGGKPVCNVTIRGLTVAVTNTPLVAGGFGAGKFGGAVELTGGEDCRLEDLEVKNVAGQGIRAWNLKSCVIEGCHVHHTGACGLKLGGECIVRNNHVHHVGCIYPSGIAVWGGGRDGQTCHIEHNTVHDTPYTAIACGGNDHRIEHNRIYRAMQVLHDGAGIYITFCKRIVLRVNYIHDIVDTGGYGASAYYLDEQAEDCLVEGNLSVGVARPSHNHMARKNTLRNNVFVCDADLTLTFPRSSDYRLEKNVIVAGGTIRITRPEAIAEAEANVLLSKSGKVEGVKMDAYQKSGTEPITSGSGWLLADPKLVEYESGKVRFAADSPAAKLGIEPIDVSTAGYSAK